MKLTPDEHDAAVELANIGISRAARQLAILLDDEITVHVPGAELIQCADGILAELAQLGPDDEVACVYQQLSGDLTGRAALLLPTRDSRLLFHNLLGHGGSLQGLDLRACEPEAMAEIGNIIISSCVSAMADMLNERITVSVPRFVETRLGRLIEDDPGSSALVVRARLKAVRRDIEGLIMLMFSSDMANHVLTAVRRLSAG